VTSEFRLRAVAPFVSIIFLIAGLCTAQDTNQDAVNADSPQGSSSLVCRRLSIYGLNDVSKRAKEWVGQNTSDPTATRVYVSVENDKLYLQSNYVTRGFEYPTKIATNKTDVDLVTLVFNLIGPSTDSGVSNSRFLRAYPKMQFFVEDKLFSDPTFNNLDFGGSPNVNIIGSDGKARKSTLLMTGEGPSVRVVEFEPNVYAHAGLDDAPSLFRRLDLEGFNRSEVEFVPMLRDSETEAAVARLIPDANQLAFRSVTNLEETIGQQTGKLFFILGKLEAGSIAAVDSSGREDARVPIEQLSSIGDRNRARVFVIGSSAPGENGATLFSGADVVQRFASALNTTTWGAFYQTLATPDLKFIFDNPTDTNGEGEHAQFGVYQDTGHGMSHRVGTVRHSFNWGTDSRPAAAMPSPGRGGITNVIWLIGLLVLGAVVVAAVMTFRNRFKKA
jgi:hypothetical protein